METSFERQNVDRAGADGKKKMRIDMDRAAPWLPRYVCCDGRVHCLEGRYNRYLGCVKTRDNIERVYNTESSVQGGDFFHWDY